MSLTLGRTGGNWMMKDGKFVNCACCDEGGDVTTPCNPTPVPQNLTLVVTYRCVQFSVTLQYNPTIIGGQPGWTYIGTGSPGDVDICGVLDFRDFSLWCVSGTWNAEFVWVESGFQQSVTTSSGLNSVTIVDTDPLCVTTQTSIGYTFSGCGDEATFYFAVGACDVVPVCCDWGSLSSTATATYTIGALAAATRSLSNISTGYSDTGFSCAVGDGTVINLSFTAVCNSGDDCIWNFGLTMLHLQLSPFILLKSMDWQLIAIPGTVRSDGTAFSCSPFHAHFEILNTDGPASASTVTCGGKAYPFGPAGTINAILDIVTP